jgi:F0F1-type ATP synthase epsilon subunit
MPLSLEVVTPKGQMLSAEGLDEVVVRRLEEAFEHGSEVVILTRHAPMLLENSISVRWRRSRIWREMNVSAGVCEVLRDCVTIVADEG